MIIRSEYESNQRRVRNVAREALLFAVVNLVVGAGGPGCGGPVDEDVPSQTMPEALTTCSWKSPYDGKTYNDVKVFAHGGAVKSAPSIILDYWGTYAALIAPTPRPSGIITTDVSNMLADPVFWTRFRQYGVAAGTLNATRMFNNASLTGLLNDSQIRAKIEGDIKADRTKSVSSKSIVVVILPPGLSSSRFTTGKADPRGSGYHDAYFSSTLSINVTYAVINAVDPTSNDAPNTVTIAHEIMEAATDPFYNLSPRSPAYLSDNPTQSEVGTGVGGATPEIGDLCNGQRAWFGSPSAPVFGQQAWTQATCRCDTQYVDLPATGCGLIAPDRALRENMAFFSCNGRFALQLQSDGNLVLVDYGVSPPHPLWASNTFNTTGNVADFQGDGNFVLYDANGSALWATGTSGNGVGGAVWVQDDGNLVVYDVNGHPLWASNTSM